MEGGWPRGLTGKHPGCTAPKLGTGASSTYDLRSVQFPYQKVNLFLGSWVERSFWALLLGGGMLHLVTPLSIQAVSQDYRQREGVWRALLP